MKICKECGIEYGGFNTGEFMKNIKATRIHFLDTPAGRKWENIVAWRIAQKENKKKQ